MVIDRGTSVLLACVPRDDYTMETALEEAANLVRQHGLPTCIVIDRDPRFVGGNPKADFPSPCVQCWLTLGVQVFICPPRRPDLKPFVERAIRTLEHECVATMRPTSLAAARAVCAWLLLHYNEQRPNQAPTCGNLPPRVAHPILPVLPQPPAQVDPNGWLQALDQRVGTRRVQRDSSISVGGERYYVPQPLGGHRVLMQLAAATKELAVIHEEREVKRLPLKGLAPEAVLAYDPWVTRLQEAARRAGVTTQRTRQCTMRL